MFREDAVGAHTLTELLKRLDDLGTAGSQLDQDELSGVAGARGIQQQPDGMRAGSLGRLAAEFDRHGLTALPSCYGFMLTSTDGPKHGIGGHRAQAATQVPGQE